MVVPTQFVLYAIPALAGQAPTNGHACLVASMSLTNLELSVVRDIQNRDIVWLIA